MSPPLISVIIPCYNSAKYINDAIDAILAQTYSNLEIIIVDDNSTDNLEKKVKPYLKNKKIKFMKLPFQDPGRINERGTNINAGYAARNYGIKFCQGEYITFQDADDGCFANRIETQYKLIKKYNCHQVNVDWQKFDKKLNTTKLKFDLGKVGIISSDKILKLAKLTSRSIFPKPFINSKNSIINVIKNIFDKIFPINWTSYPGAASMPLVKKEVFAKCNFRHFYQRTRPSRGGRGADRDFNFWVAETYKDSIVAKIPLILWRVKKQNKEY
jgi:glycosyltransferase involved in cell wall biosynthesis